MNFAKHLGAPILQNTHERLLFSVPGDLLFLCSLVFFQFRKNAKPQKSTDEVNQLTFIPTEVIIKRSFLMILREKKLISLLKFA